MTKQGYAFGDCEPGDVAACVTLRRTLDGSIAETCYALLTDCNTQADFTRTHVAADFEIIGSCTAKR